MAQRSQLEALRKDADVLAMRERRFFELADTIRKNMDGRLPDGKRRVVIETLDVRVQVLGYDPGVGVRVQLTFDLLPWGEYEFTEAMATGDTPEWAARDSNPARRIKSPVLYLMS